MLMHARYMHVSEFHVIPTEVSDDVATSSGMWILCLIGMLVAAIFMQALIIAMLILCKVPPPPKVRKHCCILVLVKMVKVNIH